MGQALRIPDPEAEIGEILQGFGRAALLWEATADLSVMAAADISRSDQGVAPHAVEVFNPVNGFGLRQSDQPPDPDHTYSLNNALMSTEDRVLGAALNIDWALGGGLDLKAIISYRDLWV